MFRVPSQHQASLGQFVNLQWPKNHTRARCYQIRGRDPPYRIRSPSQYHLRHRNRSQRLVRSLRAYPPFLPTGLQHCRQPRRWCSHLGTQGMT